MTLESALTVSALRLLPPAAAELLGEPALDFDTGAVLFGAATHDVGKVLHRGELSGPGTAHEAAGARLLLAYGRAASI